jgi:type IV pilus assembly protein PilF
MLRERLKFLHCAAGMGLLSLLLSACSFLTPDSSTREVSDEDKAVSNMDLGIRYMELGQLEIALEKLNYALDLDSGNVRIHDALAVLYERIDRDEDAEEHFQKALRLKPDDAGVFGNYGRFLCNKNRYREGMAYLTKAIATPLNNRKWYALTYAGLCELKQGNVEQAESYLRGALQLQQTYAPALFGMIKVSYNRLDYFKTRAFLDRYRGVAAHNAETLWYAVQTERQLGSPRQAEEYRQQLLQQFPLSEQAKNLKNIYIKQ